ncbi:MAG: hypothetical protein KGI60_03425 [Patescibacteria group bacterium]|nr:hypothetical protein [Patescibacteria group bacterium]
MMKNRMIRLIQATWEPLTVLCIALYASYCYLLAGGWFVDFSVLLMVWAVSIVCFHILPELKKFFQ